MTKIERVETLPFILEVKFVPIWKHVSLEIGSKQKKQWKHKISWHVHTIQVSFTQDRESHLLWIMEFSTISSWLGKAKVFPTTLNR